jgi:phosphoribosylanthranilate isomerase
VTPRLKICCISDTGEAELAVAFGAAALGLVSEMPSGPGVIPESLIADIVDVVPPAVATFLLTCRVDADSIVEQQRRTGANTVQLVDEVAPGTHGQIRRALPGVKVVQVVHVTGPEAIDRALEVAPDVDALLLDSGNPTLPVKELGGTARVHDWSLSRQIVRQCAKPVFLAGGLNAANVTAALAAVQPYGLDVCNGVRTDGRLDPEKLSSYVRAVASAGP